MAAKRRPEVFQVTGPDASFDPDALRSLIAGSEPPGLGGYLVTPVEGQALATWTAVPLLGRQVFQPIGEGLPVPEGARLPGPGDHAGVFLTLEDYFESRPTATLVIRPWLQSLDRW